MISEQGHEDVGDCSHCLPPRLAAATACVTAATGKSAKFSRTQRRRHLRFRHKDRLAQSLFIVDLQIDSLRRQVGDIHAVQVQSTCFSRDELLSFAPIKLVSTLTCATASIPAVLDTIAPVARLDKEDDVSRGVFSPQQQTFLMGLVLRLCVRRLGPGASSGWESCASKVFRDACERVKQ